ncbi:MAG: hypothetical protein ACN4GM_00905 [Gammaproteobacteria bacterium]
MIIETSNCLHDLDFEHLAYYAHQHYIEGVQTIELMEKANSEKEKEEIALVALLDVQTNVSIELSHHQPHENVGHLTDLKRVLQQYIQGEGLSEWFARSQRAARLNHDASEE